MKQRKKSIQSVGHVQQEIGAPHEQVALNPMRDEGKTEVLTKTDRPLSLVIGIESTLFLSISNHQASKRSAVAL